MRFEYKIVPAPRRGQKAKGVKGTEARFAFALEALMNDLAQDGWEYLRAETLPSEERAGLTGRAVVERHVLIFRRTIETPQTQPVAEDEAMAVPAQEEEAPEEAGSEVEEDPDATGDEAQEAEEAESKDA